MKQFQLSELESLKLENANLKAQQIKTLLDKVNGEAQKVISDFCARVSQKPEEITNINFESGMVSFAEPKTEELKAEETEAK